MRVLTAVLLFVLMFFPIGVERAQAESVDMLIYDSFIALEEFLDDPQWIGLRNALGGTRGIFIIPSLKKAGLLVGVSRGTGVLMARDGKDWSDPIFIRLTSQSLGLQAGAYDANIILLVMSDAMMDKMLSQYFGLGGDASISLGELGIGGGGSGGISEGITTLMAVNGDGLFAGTTFLNSTLSTEDNLNKKMYGLGAEEVSKVLHLHGTDIRAKFLREKLAKAVQESWYGKK
ncbi:MAG: lipid-binding SYLF domain-containing protein [Nitrospirales bacterium]|nr:lipid-binding SYLF domain-containing protein [Nitrospirales bacterium]